MTIPTSPFVEDRVCEHAAAMLTAMGFDLHTESIKDTPKRVARAMREMLAGYNVDIAALLATTFDDPHDEVVLLRGVSFYSLCEHHLLPFHGTASVAYIPSKRVVGLSKLARLVEAHARRLQLQERMTRAIAIDLETHLAPVGVGVVVRTKHLCMCARGVGKAGSEMVTSAMLGAFRSHHDARSELMALEGMR